MKRLIAILSIFLVSVFSGITFGSILHINPLIVGAVSFVSLNLYNSGIFLNYFFVNKIIKSETLDPVGPVISISPEFLSAG